MVGPRTFQGNDLKNHGWELQGERRKSMDPTLVEVCGGKFGLDTEGLCVTREVDDPRQPGDDDFEK